MTYKCPSCAAALYFNPQTQLLECNSCRNMYRPADFVNAPGLSYSEKHDAPDTGVQLQAQQQPQMQQQPQTQQQQQTQPQQPHMGMYQQQTQQQPQQPQNTMEREEIQCRIYHCNSCGAELMVNGEEAATFCAYCGQPAIVFQRIASEIKPDYIIPFRVSQEQAYNIIRNQFAKGAFIPDELRNIKIEKVHGVYVPFWLYNIHYYDNQFLKGEVKRGKSSHTEYFVREATCDFWNLTQDASLNLLDESSRRLEPYDMSGLIPFDASYLSGFYADKYERNARDFEKDARMRAVKIFNDTIQQSIRASNVAVMYNRPSCEIKSAAYAMLPVWFFTYRYEFQVYTIMVNGQTAKMVGAAPIDKKRVAIRFATLFAILAVLCSIIMSLIFSAGLGDDLGDFIVCWLVGCGVCASTGAASFKTIRNNLKYAQASETLEYATNRQDV